MGCRHRAERRPAGQHADQDEADDRADPEPREGGDDDPGGAEDDQCVAEAGGCEFAVHARLPLLPFSRERR